MDLKLITQDGCVPCKNVKVMLDEEDVFYDMININKEPSAIDKYNIMSTPVLILVDGDEEIERVVGDRNRGAIHELISKL